LLAKFKADRHSAFTIMENRAACHLYNAEQANTGLCFIKLVPSNYMDYS